MALPRSTPLLAVQREGPCRPAGAPPLFPGPSLEGEGVTAGFLPLPAPRWGGAGKSLLRAQSLEAPRLSGRWAVGSQDLNPSLPTPRQDQFDVIERHTQWGLDLLDRYVKFVKERTEVEQAYAKQLR